MSVVGLEGVREDKMWSWVLLQEIIERLLLHHHIEPDMEQIRQGIQNVLASEEEIGDHDWFALLSLLGERLQMRFSEQRLGVRALAGAEDVFPLLTVEPTAQGGRWLGLLEKKRNRYRVTRFEAMEQDLWWTEQELIDALQLESGETVRWVSMDVKTPLTSWKTEKNKESGVGVNHVLWSRFVKLLIAEKRDIWMITTYAVVIGVLSLVTPITVQALVNTVAFG
ncbi:MAG: hypothetical protein AAGJ35_09200, partial [Myxococcota bacterium]